MLPWGSRDLLYSLSNPEILSKLCLWTSVSLPGEWLVVCGWIKHFLRSFYLKFCASWSDGLSLIWIRLRYLHAFRDRSRGKQFLDWFRSQKAWIRVKWACRGIRTFMLSVLMNLHVKTDWNFDLTGVFNSSPPSGMLGGILGAKTSRICSRCLK